jgi:hypothetical protein
MILQDWKETEKALRIDLEETARQAGALLRRREIRNASDLLRLNLMYALSDWSLRLVGAWALLQGIGNLSDVAILKRLRRSSVWIGMLIGLILQRRCQALQATAGVRLRLMDATVLSRPGSQGTDWRLHLGLNLWPLGIDGIELTDARGGETLARLPPQPNEIRIVDRGYAFVSGLAPLLEADSFVVVRINWQNLPLQEETGQRLNLIAWLETLTCPAERQVWLNTPHGRFSLRLLACPLPPQAAERARQRARKNNAKKGRTPTSQTLLAAGFLLLITNLSPEAWPISRVFWLYRLRWQIELAIKRLKSLIQLDHLRVQDPRMVQVYLFSKLLAALILDELTHQVYQQQPDWFISLKRPLSIWRLTTFLWESFRQLIYGHLDWKRFFACLPILQRYFCDSPRARPQQLAWARALMDSANPFSSFNC